MAYHAGHFKVVPLGHDTAISATTQLLETFDGALFSFLFNFLALTFVDGGFQILVSDSDNKCEKHGHRQLPSHYHFLV